MNRERLLNLVIALGLLGAAIGTAWYVRRPIQVEEIRVRRETEIAAELAATLKGEAEHRLYDGTRVDILTETEAIECDWTDKWAEGIGQALFYAQMTEKRPVLILFHETDDNQRFKYFERALFASQSQPDFGLWLYDVETGELRKIRE